MGVVRDAVREVLSSLTTSRISYDDLITRAQAEGGYRNTWPDLVKRYAEDSGWVLDETTEVFHRTEAELLEVEIIIKGKLTPIKLGNLQRLFG